MDWEAQQYKTYPQAPRVALPRELPPQGPSLEAVMARRRSHRRFRDLPLSLMELSHLLRYAAGITEERWGLKLRAAPSAGALYPIEVYAAAHRVEGVEAGLYHYEVRGHGLEQVKAGDLQEELTRLCHGQRLVGRAGAAFLLTGLVDRSFWKYGERTYRYMLLEAGHIAQNLCLAASSLGLGSCAVGAFDDQGLNQLLGIDGINEGILYIVAVGKP